MGRLKRLQLSKREDPMSVLAQVDSSGGERLGTCIGLFPNPARTIAW